MTIRHKAKKVSLQTGLVSEWNDDHHADFEDEVISVWTFTSTNLPDEFTIVEENGGTVEVSMVDNHNFCNVNSNGGSDGLAVLILGDDDVTNKLNLPIFTTALKLETTEKIEFGFFVYAGTPFTANQKGAYFRVAANKIYAVVGNGTNETTADLGAPSTYAQYKIEFTSSDVRFYINDLTAYKTAIATNVPVDDLTIKYACARLPGEEQICRVDGVALMRLRKK